MFFSKSAHTYRERDDQGVHQAMVDGESQYMPSRTPHCFATGKVANPIPHLPREIALDHI
jgi:hypothetical protein